MKKKEKKVWVSSLGWGDPLEKEMATHSSILPGKSHGQRRPWGCKESGETYQQTTNGKILYVNKWTHSIQWLRINSQVFKSMSPLLYAIIQGSGQTEVMIAATWGFQDFPEC